MPTDPIPPDALELLRAAKPRLADGSDPVTNRGRSESLFNAVISGQVQPPPRSGLLRRSGRVVGLREALDPTADDLVSLLRFTNPVASASTVGEAQSEHARYLFSAITAKRRRAFDLARSRGHGWIPANAASAQVIDLLRGMNPAPVSLFAGAGASMKAEALCDRILTGAADAPTRTPWWRRRRVLVPIAASFMLASAAAGYVLANEQATVVSRTACYGAASTQAPFVYAFAVNGASPTEACAVELSQSQAVLGVPTPSSLVGCVLPGGLEAVFPGRDSSLCTKLNLPAAAPPSPEQQAATQLVFDVNEKLGVRNCMDPAAATALVDNELQQLGLDGWSVSHPAQASAGLAGSCASAEVLFASKAVKILTIPDVQPTGAR